MGKEHIIRNVEEGSIAWEMGIEPGDKLLSINDNKIEDVFDYHFLVNDEELVLLIEKPDGEEWESTRLRKITMKISELSLSRD